MEKALKINIKKILLLLSLLPYLIFLVTGIFNIYQTSIDKGYLDLYAFIEPLGNFWIEIITNLNVVLIFLTIFCIGYPIYYLLDRHTMKKNNVLEAQSKVNKPNKLFVLYMISFIPYLYLIYSCIFGIQFGFFFNTSTYYGFEAIILALLSGSIIPIYPIVGIFQIIFTIKKYKMFSNFQKRFLKSMITILLLLLLIPSILYLISTKVSSNTIYSQDKVIIENYLKEEFGEDYYNNMEIIKPYHTASTYKIKTPLLNDSFEISLNETRTEIISNSFYKDFVTENNLNTKLSNYLNQKYNFPESLDVSCSIYDFDIANYNNIDNLLINCSYKIHGFYVSRKYYNKEEIIEIIKDYFINYDQTLEPYYNTNFLLFYVQVNDKDYASIQAIKNRYEEGEIHLIFSGYNYGNGYTIPHEDLTINIYETANNN